MSAVTRTSRSESGNGRGLKMTALTTANIAALAPMPSARVADRDGREGTVLAQAIAARTAHPENRDPCAGRCFKKHSSAMLNAEC